MVMFILYVDDMLIIGNDLNKLEEVQKTLSSVFEMKDLSEPRSFLGMTIKSSREEKIIKIHQTDYIEKILERNKMEESKHYNKSMVTDKLKTENIKLELKMFSKNCQ